MKKADEEISNLNLPIARKLLEKVLMEKPDNKKAEKLLSFVEFLEGKKSKSPAQGGSFFPNKGKGGDPSGNLTPQTLLKIADREISNLNLPAARKVLKRVLQETPNDDRAKEMLVLVNFLEGEERQPPDEGRMFDSLHEKMGGIELDGYSGYFFRESNTGIVETTSVLETTLDKFRLPGLSGGILLEGRGYEDNDQEANSRVIGTRLNYSPGSSKLICLTVAPEIFDDNKTVGQYELGVYSKVKNWKLGLESEKNTFRDNLHTIQERMQKKDMNLSVSRKLNKTVELRQGLLWGTISDGNSSLSFDTKLKFHFLPEWALDLKFSQSAFNRQLSEEGETLNYWSPKTYRSLVMALGWKKRLSQKWKCGIETSFSGSSTKETVDTSVNYNEGLGILVNTGYLFSAGDIGLSYADRINLSAREKRFNLSGNMRF
ncbi:MAG: hypothetical protein WA705_11670 [Candidatus Ozemobacteraceae bacterium]